MGYGTQILNFSMLLKNESNLLTKNDLGIFALVCCERQFPVYFKAAIGKPWGAPEILRNYLDLAWKYFKGELKRIFSELDTDACVNCAHYDPVATNEIVAADVAYSVSGVVSFLVSLDPDYIFGASDTSFNMLDSLIYALLDCEVTSESDKIVDQHELVQAELICQQSDLKLISDSENISSTIEILKRRVVTSGIFGALWYPKDY